MKDNAIVRNGGIKPDSESKKPVIWTHVGSWEEYEILQPVVKRFSQDGSYTILMTYSPLFSANENQLRGYDYIDYLFPLSLDDDSNVELFISTAKPSAVIFSMSACRCDCVFQLKKRNIPAFLVAAKIKRASPFLKWNDSSYKNTLKAFTHIFVFDNESKAFLDKSGLVNTTVDGYPPIGDVWPKDENHYRDSIIERFIAGERFVFIGGNIDTDKDLKLVARLANTNPALKCLLVPHTISEEHLDKIKYELDGFTLLYSECDENTDLSNVQVLVMDFMGALSQVFRYGSCAYIGGEFASCLHNVIEATANGLPTSFSPRIKHGILPDYLVGQGMSRIVKSPNDICEWTENLKLNPVLVKRINSDSVDFVERGIEATHGIYTHIKGHIW